MPRRSGPAAPGTAARRVLSIQQIVVARLAPAPPGTEPVGSSPAATCPTSLPRLRQGSVYMAYMWLPRRRPAQAIGPRDALLAAARQRDLTALSTLFGQSLASMPDGDGDGDGERAQLLINRAFSKHRQQRHQAALKVGARAGSLARAAAHPPGTTCHPPGTPRPPPRHPPPPRRTTTASCS
jgi:hypothetical protein